jgi:Ion channel
MNYLRLLVHLRRNPSAILLVVQLLALVLYPFFEDTEAGRIGLGIFGIFVLVTTMRMVLQTRFINWIGIGIALPAIALLMLQMVRPVPQLAAWSAGLESLFYFYAAGSLIAYMLGDRHATTDELFAAGATFTLLAWAFAYLFLMTQALQPDSFSGALRPDSPRTWTELMHLSFALLSSTGMGDVLPMSGPARGVAAVEMFAGVMYLAAVVSRLIGLTLQGPRGHYSAD